MTYENYIKGRLLEYAVQEAYSYGGLDCMAAVAQVIANRQAAGWGEWKNVIDTAPNYVGTIVAATPVDAKDLTFRRMLGMIDDIYHGTADATNINIEDDRGKQAALYYADLSKLSRTWFTENITQHMDRHPRLATVGPLTFFA